MKSSYRLIGMFWDHRPESAASLDPVPFDPFYLEAGHPDCLFDCDGKRRYVALTELLAVDSQRDLDMLLARLEGCTGIGVILDYEPASWGSVVRVFFRHRTLQALRLLEEMLPGTKVTLMRSPELVMAA